MLDEQNDAPENAPENAPEEFENTEMTELEEKDLEGVAGGEETLDGNVGCNCNCSES